MADTVGKVDKGMQDIRNLEKAVNVLTLSNSKNFELLLTRVGDIVTSQINAQLQGHGGDVE